MIDDVIVRLKAQAPQFRTVDGAIAFAAIDGAPPIDKRPAVWAVPLSDSAKPNHRMNGVAQEIEELVGLVMCVGEGRTVGSEATLDPLDAAREAAIAALLGWQPPGGGPLEYAGGALLGHGPRVVWWQLQFRRQRHRRG